MVFRLKSTNKISCVPACYATANDKRATKTVRPVTNRSLSLSSMEPETSAASTSSATPTRAEQQTTAKSKAPKAAKAPKAPKAAKVPPKPKASATSVVDDHDHDQQQQVPNKYLIAETRERTSQTHPQHIEYLKTHPNVEVVLFGDSHFERFLTNRGPEPVERLLVDKKVAVTGVGGDKVQHMLRRVNNGLFDTVPRNLKHVFIDSGGNNITNGDDPTLVAEAVFDLWDRITDAVGPTVKVWAVEVPPPDVATKKIKKEAMLERTRTLNTLLHAEAERRKMAVVPLFTATLLPDSQNSSDAGGAAGAGAGASADTGAGTAKDKTLAPARDPLLFEDHVHLNQNGYSKFAELLLSCLS